MAETIDNLGPEVHQRYIEDTRLLSDEEVQKVFQTPSIAKRAEILKTAPKYSEIDILWGVQEKETSFFAQPPDFVLTTNVFTHSLIPSIGSGSEILKKLQSLKEEKESDVQKQKKVLEKFAQNLTNLNKILQHIQRKKEEFHKG